MPAPDRPTQEEAATAPSQAASGWLQRIRTRLARRRNGVHETSKGAMADLNDLRHAYRLLLGREPDAAGFASKHPVLT